ncbi:MAG: zinc ribbon domain-containing protein [Oligoflexia bacterium]|nr:zinc ribbon domain-containing protein [Oligoflexia bacterium]
MPLYEYECSKCNQVHEIMQKFSDAPMTECPVCHGPVKKLISSSSFALKGSGWYTTDYKRKNTPSSSGSGSSGS